MRSRKNNRWWLTRRSLLLVNLAVFVLIAWGFAGEHVRDRRLTAEITRLETEAEKLEARNFEVVKLGQRFAADETIEREARLKLGLRKPGESVIIVKGAEAASLPAGTMLGPDMESDTFGDNFHLWWRYFFGEEQEPQPN